jgi:transcription-repair coupling factor (superfamily II helicase)
LNDGLLNSIFDNLHNRQDIMLSGLSASARTFFINELYQRHSGKLLCLVPNEESAYDLAQEMRPLLGEGKIYLFLFRDFVFMKENTSRVEVERILTMQNLLNHPRQKTVVITTAGALLYKIISPPIMTRTMITLLSGQEISIHALLKNLVEAGYSREDTVARPGQLAVRGGLIDVFPVASRDPLRIEFFGDVIESIRSFDVNSQRSAKKHDQVMIGPADELAGEQLTGSLFDYLPENALIFFDEAREFYNALDRHSRRYRQLLKEARQDDKKIRELPLLSHDDIVKGLDNYPVCYHSFFPGNIPQARVALYQHISQQEMEPFHIRQDSLFPRLRDWLDKQYTVRLAVNSETRRQELARELSDQHLSGAEMVSLPYGRGFVSSTLQLAVVTETDIWGRKKGKISQRQKQSSQRLLVEDLKRGDYVVHENHGIGIFRGVTQVETDGVTREYLLIQYAGTDKLYLPVDKLDLLYRYSSSEDKEPRLSKLGGTEWDRTRKKVAQSIQDMARELLCLYAARETVAGHAFSPDTPWQRQFEDNFPYQETPDQLKAIQAVKRDMEDSRPMDRLICGDVGYGKTEVALRAAFKAIMDSKQVAVLVPTTVLAEQHYQTFKDRFQEFPAVVEVLSRFVAPAQQKKIVSGVAQGSVDILIATHRLLSKDIKFHNLGLLVVDEEHRFGVAQKEKIKALKQQVDVLSLSATPIPRSMHMSLTGLRDLSTIETPPPERYPITTYVMEYNPEIVREAVNAEVSRGGQVFFVHNRIQDIYRIKDELQKYLPQVRIAIGHGRMAENELARTMMDFMQGRYDLFLCTTIIESGLDMPNVNTIIVDMADKMGLAQLYQLRGRVGRSNRLAYAYLTYRPDKIITEEAQKRLNAVREFNELGAGMKIALRDLEIRGAGNILGPEQHGHIHALALTCTAAFWSRRPATCGEKSIRNR